MITKAVSMTLVITSGAVIAVTIALAATQTTQGSGTAQASGPSTAPGQVKKTASPTPGPAEPPSKSLTISPNPLTVAGLAPGKSLARTLTIGNPNNQDVVLQGLALTISGASPAPAVSLPCNATPSTTPDFEVVVSGSTSGEILKNSSKNVPVVIRMNNSATRNQDGCKAKTFTFSFTATATSK